eukprot:14362803-Alexandrium_andersonii.AAC.1
MLQLTFNRPNIRRFGQDVGGGSRAEWGVPWAMGAAPLALGLECSTRRCRAGGDGSPGGGASLRRGLDCSTRGSRARGDGDPGCLLRGAAPAATNPSGAPPDPGPRRASATGSGHELLWKPVSALPSAAAAVPARAADAKGHDGPTKAKSRPAEDKTGTDVVHRSSSQAGIASIACEVLSGASAGGAAAASAETVQAPRGDPEAAHHAQATSGPSSQRAAAK